MDWDSGTLALNGTGGPAGEVAELVVAFPLRSFYMPLAFFGMMAQVPMLPLSASNVKTLKPLSQYRVVVDQSPEP